MDYDKEVLPGDICILMKKCNGNHTFHKIYNRLNELYKTKGFIDKIKIFETRSKPFSLKKDLRVKSI